MPPSRNLSDLCRGLQRKLRHRACGSRRLSAAPETGRQLAFLPVAGTVTWRPTPPDGRTPQQKCTFRSGATSFPPVVSLILSTVFRRTILMGLRPAQSRTTPRPWRLAAHTPRAEAHGWSKVLAPAPELCFGGSGVRTPKLRRRKTVTPLPTRPGGPKLPPCRVVKLVTDLRVERLRRLL